MNRLLFVFLLGNPLLHIVKFIGIAFLGAFGLSLTFTFLAAIAAKAQQQTAEQHPSFFRDTADDLEPLLSALDDPYNGDFLRAAQVVFLSDESLPAPPEEFARELGARFGTEVVVVGMGAKGALLHLPAERTVERFPAVRTRSVVSTVGAGDALFSAFLDGYARERDARAALRRAVVFASWKLGAASAAEGFLGAEPLRQLIASDPAPYEP